MTKVPHTGEEERERSRTEDAQRLRELETGRTRKLMRRLGQDLSQSVIATLVIGVLLLGSILTYVLTEGFSSELVWTALMLTGGSFAVFAIAFVFVPILVQGALTTAKGAHQDWETKRIRDEIVEGSEVAGSLEVADAQGQNGALTQSRRRSGLTDVAECEDADASEANEAGAQEQEQRVEADEVSVVDASRG